MFRMSRASLLLNHSALALFAQRTRIPTSARSIGFCAIWVCISSSSSSVFALVACICAFQKALSSVFPPIKSAGSECPLRFTSQVHEAFLRAIFAPEGHRLNFLVRRRTPAALSIACPLFCCIGPIMDHVAIRCGYMPLTIGDCCSSPMHQYFTRPFKESIVFRLGLTCIQVWTNW